MPKLNGFCRTSLTLLLLSTLLAVGCLEKEFNPDDPAESFVIAREPYDDELYDIALTKLGEYRARFPYSHYAIEAELLIADSYYKLDRFEEAAASYEQFVKLHPNHDKVDFAMFRVGECYWQDAPEEIDRDQEFTKIAISEWEKLVLVRPDSPYTKKARKLIGTGRRRLAESQEFIAKFYCKLEIYHSCAYRSIELSNAYPQFPKIRANALKRAARALEEVAKEKEADPESDANLYHRDYSPSEIREIAGKLIGEFERSQG